MSKMLKKLREEAGLTQTELAAGCGWPHNNGRISQYESGIVNIGPTEATEMLDVIQDFIDREITIKEKLAMIGAEGFV